MYRKDSVNWLKHADFIVLDLLSLLVSYLLSCYVVQQNPFGTVVYRNLSLTLLLFDLLVIFFYGTFKNVLKRGVYSEFTVTVKHVLFVFGVLIGYRFLIKQTAELSRLIVGLTFFFYFLLSLSSRYVLKKKIQNRKVVKSSRNLFLIANRDILEDVVKNISETTYNAYNICGCCVIDQNLAGKKIGDTQVTVNVDECAQYVGKEWVDEVLIVTDPQHSVTKKLIDDIVETGVTLHINVLPLTSLTGKRQFVEKVGSYAVLTVSLNYASAFQLFLKRCMDIFAGIVGCLLTCIIFIFVAPIIYINSPGPIFFAQTRVGKNGKKFKMYKFRSMYLDAEERKKELMDQNKVKDGLMFKMDFDPRIIGNKILPDGTHKTGIGQFIRKTSLDEFPQFFNVLKGDMSLVGTRPPTEDETSLYDLHHYSRLSIKPGITGMWQISGRSDITDFEEVVRLDKQYIENWNPGLDIKILLKTIQVVFDKQGSM